MHNKVLSTNLGRIFAFWWHSTHKHTEYKSAYWLGRRFEAELAGIEPASLARKQASLPVSPVSFYAYSDTQTGLSITRERQDCIYL